MTQAVNLNKLAYTNWMSQRDEYPWLPVNRKYSLTQIGREEFTEECETGTNK